MGRGRRLTAVAATLGIATIGVALFATRDRILEEWHLHRLQKGDPQSARDAAVSLGRMGSIRALPIILESIESRTSRQLIHVRVIGISSAQEPSLRTAELFGLEEHVKALFAIVRAHPQEATPDLLEAISQGQSHYLDQLAKDLLAEIGVDWQDALLRQSTWVPVSGGNR